MKKHDKLVLAGELLLDAAKTYRAATTDVGFAKSILISGAVIGIVGPYLEEIGAKPSQNQYSEIAARLRGIDLETCSKKERSQELGKSLRFYRLAYNSLKHAGDRHTAASDNRFIEADLKNEAGYLLEDAIDDYRRLTMLEPDVNEQLSGELSHLLQSPWVN